MDDEETYDAPSSLDESDRRAGHITYSIEVKTSNSRLSDAERAALRNMVQLMLGEVSAKLQFVLDDTSTAKVEAFVTATNTGRRALKVEE